MSIISDVAQTPRSTREPSTRWALVGLSLSMLLSSLGTSIANVALPTLAYELGASFQAVQWVVLAYLLAITISIVTAGRLGDLFGRRRLLRAGLVLFTAASIVGGLAPALWLVIAARAAQGLGAAVMMALSVAYVGEIRPKTKTGSAMGLLGTTSAIGTALGPSLGGVLIAEVSWRVIFLVNIPLALVALVLAHRTLPADRAASKTDRVGIDVTGTVLLALTLAAYALALTIGRGQLGALNIALMSAAALGATLFVLAEKRAEKGAAVPLIRLTMFRNPLLSASLATSLLVSTVLMATLVVGPFYLSLALGLNAGLVGLVMSVGPIAAALTGVPAGRIVDRFGTQRTTEAGLLGIASGCVVLSAAPATLGIPGYVVPIVVITAGYALFQTANNTAVMKDATADQRGVFAGTLSLSRNLGLITGASVMGAVFALASGASDISAAPPAAVAAGMRVTFAVAAALVVVAIAVVIGGRALSRMRALAWILALALVPAAVSAQDRDAKPDRGFVLRSADGANSLRLAGLVQLQYAHDWHAGAPETDSLFVNRARVGLLGSVFSRDLRYLLVAELGGEARLLFLTVDYTLVQNWLAVRVGQFKRPFSRSFITMASELSMIDRPLTVGSNVFGDSVDVGAMLHNGSSGPFEYAVGVFRGSAAGDLPDRVDPLLAVRVGYHTRDLDGYRESDLDGGPPRFAIAAAGLIDFDADRDHESFSSGVVDVLLEAYGFSITSAFYIGARQGGPSWSQQHLGAIGHHTQLGYVIAGRVEPVIRYAFLMPTGADDDQHDVAAGLNVYFQGHALKAQVSVSARFLEGRDTPDIHLQSQLSLAL